VAKKTTPPPPKRSQGPQQRSARKRAAPPPTSSKGAGLSSRKWLYIATAGIAAAVAVALILVSVLGGGSKTVTPAAIDGTATQQLLDGIPQQGSVLGAPDAPVTLVEYADPRCPFCQKWSTEVFPTVVSDYVRTGKVKIEYRGIPLLGAASVRPLSFVYAAGDQNRLWNVTDLMYQNQGPEDEPWVTDALMRGVGGAIPGFDTDAMFSQLDSSGVQNAITKAENQAESNRISSTPSFLVGKSGGELEPLTFSEITVDQFTQALDEQLGA
jgi:protein-disulfide isomerase